MKLSQAVDLYIQRKRDAGSPLTLTVPPAKAHCGDLSTQPSQCGSGHHSPDY
jgi:hypothetical protein